MPDQGTVKAPLIVPSAGEKASGALEAATLARGAEWFDQSGTLVLHGVFDVELIDLVRDHFVATYRRDFGDQAARRAEQVGHQRSLVVVEIEGPINQPALYAAPLLFPLLQRLLGDDCIVGQFGSVTSLPGAEDQRIHRDSPWLFDLPATDVSLPPFAITVVIPLVDMSVEGAGTTRVWPGTHRLALDDEAALRPFADPVLPRGSCLLMDSRVRHGGTANRSEHPRPILYLSYQRRWFRDYDGYTVKPPVHVGAAEFARVPRDYRPLFAWARPDNTPETFQLAARRLAKRLLPEKVKAALRGRS